MNKPIGRPGTEKLAEAGIAVHDDSIDIQKVSESDLGRTASEEAFMNEPVTIRISQTTDPNAPPYAVVVVNGADNRVVVQRGVPTRVKRSHVEVLARMREVRYTQRQAQGNDLESGNALYPSVGQVYPFEVVKDDNPKGRAWLDNILAEPV